MNQAPRPSSERLLPFREKPDARHSLQSALNLGPQTSAWLVAIGLGSLDEVRTLGPIEVCRRLRVGGFPVSVTMAYALEGALTGCHWNRIPRETKEFLAIEFARMKHALAAKNKTPVEQRRRRA